MKRYIRSSIKPEKLEFKKKYIDQVIDKIRKGTASIGDISKACDSVVWLWRWKHIDSETKDRLCDKLINAMDGVDNFDDSNLAEDEF